MSYRCAISVPKARAAFQAVCAKAYSHKYYHIAEEQEKFVPEEVVINDSNSIDDSMEVVIDSSIIDASMNLDETTTNVSTTHSRWKIKVTKTTNNKYALPSTCSVGDFWHLKACHQKIAANKTLLRYTED